MKIKPLSKDQILLSIDRLTRFRYTEQKYLRVFKSLILQHLIEPKFNKNDLECMDYVSLKKYAQGILNLSIKEITGSNSSDLSINKKLFKYENSVANLDENSQNLLKNSIDYKSCLDFIDGKSPKNLIWLKALDNSVNIVAERKMRGFQFPIERVVLVEGATEETLLPVFARLYNYDFDKNGVYVIPAGGKNQVVRIFYELYEQLKLPIFVLFDKDGAQNAKEIVPKLRKFDKIHIISCGEFEDILPRGLVERTLNSELKNISEIDDFQPIENPGHRVEYLEEIFKNRGLHEFKKVEFSQKIKENISSEQDLTPEIIQIIEEIKNLKSNS